MGIRSDTKANAVRRLARIEGQVRGVAGMIEDERYCIDVVRQIQAIKAALAGLEGVILDPVYEGKSMAGLLDLVADGEIAKDSTVLYAHLGGQLALNAYSSIF